MSLKIAEDLFRCPRCKEFKHKEDFGIDPRNKHGVTCYCKACIAEDKRARYRASKLPPREPLQPEVSLRRRTKPQNRDAERYYCWFN